MLLVADINQDILISFRKFAVGKHGKLYGSLKPEIEAALQAYLDKQKSDTPYKEINTTRESPQNNLDNPRGGSR